MALSGFTFPGVTLKQNFIANTAVGIGDMSVVCIGRHERVHNYASDIDPEALSSIYTGTALSDQAIPGYNGGTIVGSTVSLFTPGGLFCCNKLGNSSADFTAPTSSTKYITFTATSASIEGKTGEKAVEAGDTAFLTYGTGSTATVKSMTVIDADATNKKVGFSGDVFVSGSTISSIYFCAAADGNLGSATPASGKISVAANKTADVVIDGSTYTSKPLRNGTIYVDYVEKDPTYNNEFGLVTSTDGAIEALGTPCAANPLALCVYQAVANSAGTPVYFTSVTSDTYAAYITAMAIFDTNADVYSFVPATYEEEVIRQMLSKCTQLSDDDESKIRRVLWYGVKTDIEAGGASSVVCNDVRAQRLTQSYRAVCVWADDAKFNGEIMPNYAVAAAAAGLRSGTYCHKPISNTRYSSFSVSEPHKLSIDLYEYIAADGIWVVGNNSNGVATNFKQITTALSNNNINLNEESCVSNTDNIALSICNIGADLVGCSNISTGLLVMLSNQINVIMNQKATDMTGDVTVGAQLTEWELVSITQNTVNLDHVDAIITCTPPRPFNRFNMTLNVL